MTTSRPKSYLNAMLTSEANMYAGLTTLALGAMAAVPMGFRAFGLSVLALAVGEALAALFIPDLPVFRAKVDEENRRNQRANVRSHLIGELGKRLPIAVDGWQLVSADHATEYGSRRVTRDVRDDAARRMDAYNTMIERICTLAEIAADRRTQLGPREVERLHEAGIDYLAMWLARMIIDSREKAFDEDALRAKISELDAEIAAAKTPAQQRQLRQARKDYADLLTRRGAMDGKAEAIDAAMISMPDKIDEIYQMVMAAPTAPGMGDKLEDSLSRLRLEEELEQELSLDLSSSLSSPVLAQSFAHATPVAKPALAKKAAASQKTLN